MAFSFSKDNDTVAGDLRYTSGTFTNTAGSTGGDIYTGLQRVYGMILQQKKSAVIATQPKVNETAGSPMSDPVTIITEAVNNVCGYWLAFGA